MRKIFTSNNKGVALFMALILGLVSVMFLSTLLYMISTGTRMSGLERTYSTAIEAVRGGSAIMCRVLDRGVSFSDFTWLDIRDQTCLESKRDNETSSWNCSCPTPPTCPSGTTPTSSDFEGIRCCFDLHIDMIEYDVYLKVVNTKGPYIVGGKRRYIYTIHALAVSKQDENDKAWVTFVYKTEET